MDNEKLKQFILPIVVLIIGLSLSFVLVQKSVTVFQSYSGHKKDVETKQTQIKDKQDKLEQYKKDAQKEAEKIKETKERGNPFYKPIESGMDSEAVIAGEFAEILQLIRANQIKGRSIKYDYDPSDDAFVQGAGAKYNVARLNTEMIANYTNYDNFLKELYKHEHFLDIQSVEIVPYRKNKKILLINFKLKLYAEK